ncbi:MAG: hydrolase 1, exosortase A system-associated [Pseudomonadota bacterium]
MSAQETPLVFSCAGEHLVGMLHAPATPSARGVLIVVGGPQYRVGSHRQFLLLARELCARGVPVMRFDYRGMGDSGGEPIDFMATGPDIRAALDAMFAAHEALESVVLWGLCDAASGVLGYAHGDPRVAGIVILNPWVRSEMGLAKTTLREYYLGRLTDGAFWRDLVRGRLALGASLRSLGQTVHAALRPSAAGGAAASDNGAAAGAGAPCASGDAFIDTMREGLARFTGPVLLILSGDDLTAGEFRELIRARRWRRLLARPNVTRQSLEPANHTFARAEWRQQVADWTWQWLRAW